MRKGIAVSPGVAVGTAYCIHDIRLSPDQARLEDHQVAGELSASEAAREKAAADLRALQTKVASQLGYQEAAIFSVHEAILRAAAGYGTAQLQHEPGIYPFRSRMSLGT